MEIIVAVIGLIGVIGAAFISTGIFNGKNKKTHDEPKNEVPIPYTIHRDELDKKEFEIRRLIAKVSVYEGQSGNGYSTQFERTGTLVDFFYGVTDDSKLKWEVSIKENGRMAVFHNKLWRHELKHVEFYLDSMKLQFTVLVKDRGEEEKRSLVIPIKNDLAIKMYEGFGIVLVVRMDEEMKHGLEGAYVPLAVYASSKVINSKSLENSSSKVLVKELIKEYSDQENSLKLNFYDVINVAFDKPSAISNIWNEGSVESSAPLISQLDSKFPEIGLSGISKFYWAHLSFYESSALVSVEMDNKEGSIPVFFIITKQEVIFLNGSSAPIHNANWSAPLRLNSDNIIDYLKFFCFFMKIEGEIIYVVDSGKSLPSYISGQRKALKKKLKGIGFSATHNDVDDMGNFSIKCKTLSSSGIDECNFIISQYGMIELAQVNNLISDLQIKVNPNYFTVL